MGDYVTDAVVKSCVDLQRDLHLPPDGHPSFKPTHCLSHGLEPSYESTYQEVHKAKVERLRSSVQTPAVGTFMYTDLTWTSQIRAKGWRAYPRVLALVLVAYIPWARVQDFVKGEEAHIDGPCKFVCQGTPSNQ